MNLPQILGGVFIISAILSVIAVLSGGKQDGFFPESYFYLFLAMLTLIFVLFGFWALVAAGF